MGALVWLINTAVDIYILVIIARAIMSWVNPSPYHPAVRFLYRVTEPVLGRVRQIIPPLGGLDLSPIIVILALIIVRNFIISLLYDLAGGPGF